MKIDVQTGEKSYQRVMTVEVPWEELVNEFRESFSEFRSEVEMPGFRKGKVPAKVIRQKYGQQIERDFAANALENYYREAIDEIEDEPVNRGAVEDLDFSEGEPMIFRARFEVEPDIEIPEYKQGFELGHTTFEATQTDVDGAVNDLRERHAEVNEVEGESGEGHMLMVDLQQVEPDGTPIIGQKVEDRYLKVGEGVFGGENLDRLTGAKKGDTRRVVIQPQDEGDEVGHYDVTIKKIEEHILPELDDELAEKVQGDAKTYDGLRDEILDRIQRQLDEDSESQLGHQIAHHFVSRTNFKVPQSMVDNYLDMLIEDVKRQRQQEGNEPEIDETVFKENYKSDAIFNLKWQLIKKEIIDREELTVDEEKLEQRIDDVVESYPEENRQAVRNLYDNEQYRGRIREDLLDDVVMEHIRSFADIKETRKTTTEVRQEQQAQQAAKSAVEEIT